MKLIATVNTQIFSGLMSVIAACGGDMVLYFTETELSVCVPQGVNQIALWAGFSTQHLFSKYRIVSQSGNTIALKCNSQQLAHALNVETSPTINMNLSKINKSAVLQFEHRSSDTTKQLVQRVAVTLLRQQALDSYQEPAWGDATVTTKFPPLRATINWVNEMKDINNLVTITATKEGVVSFKVDSDSVSVETKFSGLEIPFRTDMALLDEAEALVDIKKLKKILKIGTLQSASGELHIYDKSQIRMFFTIPTSIPDQPTSFTYTLNATTKSA
jgi:antitoxin component of RelBE/YafQ-DinJ toxin-antitoxin module